MKNRIFFYDLVRFVACIMVVVMHAPMPSKNIVGVFTWGITYFTMPCIGLFFTVSGALLLPVSCFNNNSITFVKRRIKKFVVPVFIWSVIYLLVQGVFFTGDINNIMRSLCSIPFRRQEGVLWFMYTLVGLYLIAPVISPWLEQASKRTIQVYLGIWGISLLYPYLQPFVEIEESAYGICYYTSGFVGYFVLGYYLRRYGLDLSLKCSLGGWLIMQMIPVFFKIFIDDKELCFGDTFWYLSVDSPILVVLWWNILKRMAGYMEHNDRLKKSCIIFSDMSFGIYLSHILIMRYGLWHIQEIVCINNYIIQTIVIIVLTLLASFFFCYVISLSPIGKYVICYNRRNK